MEFTIKQVAERTRLPASTLRFYDRTGLMPLLKKTEYGTRKYSEMDICWLELVRCLRDSGMPLEDIKAFMRSVWKVQVLVNRGKKCYSNIGKIS
ncbi:MerR HTH family regulatory protein [Paenibacillus polysaccharolyticus]|uniref:MerR HTH family regulatory protein n=1 Tax=Paenibacillus polysaccharolyticus TaxID=582692 RepID=A0A1G5D5I6_9BACL|nr:MerR family transcriptional regulator [Paenibacillus polysaccharolyticus]SCY10109.1 MerR HTH family regulatory protein [Paenibacillus polysaccharolyticus]